MPLDTATLKEYLLWIGSLASPKPSGGCDMRLAISFTVKHGVAAASGQA
jgi:hypothetical protein